MLPIDNNVNAIVTRYIYFVDNHKTLPTNFRAYYSVSRLDGRYPIKPTK